MNLLCLVVEIIIQIIYSCFKWETQEKSSDLMRGRSVASLFVSLGTVRRGRIRCQKAENTYKSQMWSILFSSGSSLILFGCRPKFLSDKTGCKTVSNPSTKQHKPDLSGFVCINSLSLHFYSHLFREILNLGVVLCGCPPERGTEPLVNSTGLPPTDPQKHQVPVQHISSQRKYVRCSISLNLIFFCFQPPNYGDRAALGNL